MKTLFLWIFEMLAAVLSFSAGISIAVFIMIVTVIIVPSHAASGCGKFQTRIADLSNASL